MLRSAQTFKPDNVTFACEPWQYPPKLIVVTRGSKLRLLFEFGVYYSEDDLLAFAEEGRTYNYSVLLCHFPNVKEEDFFTPANLSKIWADDMLGQRWIRSALEDQRREYYRSMASIPKEWGSGYECPIHIGWYREKYSARWVDCAYCEYNLDKAPNCLCLAMAGSKQPALYEQIIKLRQRNDKRIQQQRANRAKRQVYSNYRPSPLPVPDHPDRVPRQDSSEELHAEEERMKDTFDPLSTEILRDKFNRRWVKCTCCGVLKQEQEMSFYGGPGIECNKGECSICVRQRRNNT